ncbi:hypothetical protein [Streptomyces sp. NPDC088725]|uniref:hypothetical protein n=1 Tax=Streptomyces sp. NPDC088725 TaxID=3365873 RepID=UPI00381939EA
MSAQEERDALALPPALYDQALHLLSQSPEQVPPRRGFSFSPRPGPDTVPVDKGPLDATLPREEAQSAFRDTQHAIREALNPLPADSATLHRRLAPLGTGDRHLYLIRSAVAKLPLPDDQREAARSLGRQLTRTGTTGPAVAVGLALLSRLGKPEDIPCLVALSVFRKFTRLAVDARPSSGSTFARAAKRPCHWFAPCGRGTSGPSIRSWSPSPPDAKFSEAPSPAGSQRPSSCPTCSISTPPTRLCSPWRPGSWS